MHGKELRLPFTYDAFYKNMTNKKYHTVGTVQKSNRNIVERRTKLISRTHIYITAHFSGCTVSCRIKLSLWSQTFLLKLFLSTGVRGKLEYTPPFRNDYIYSTYSDIFCLIVMIQAFHIRILVKLFKFNYKNKSTSVIVENKIYMINQHK